MDNRKKSPLDVEYISGGIFNAEKLSKHTCTEDGSLCTDQTVEKARLYRNFFDTLRVGIKMIPTRYVIILLCRVLFSFAETARDYNHAAAGKDKCKKHCRINVVACFGRLRCFVGMRYCVNGKCCGSSTALRYNTYCMLAR